MPASDPWESAVPLKKRTLNDEHRRLLEDESGIDSELIDLRGYYSPTESQVKRMVAMGLVHRNILQADGWLAIPICRPDGVKHGEIIRLFGHKGKMKYVWPTGQRNTVDVHPSFRDLLLDPTIPILATEGVKKSDAILSAALREGFECVVLGLNGCWGWKAKVGNGTIALPDFHDIPLAGRVVLVVSDSDFRTNDTVRRGWSDATTYFASKSGGSKARIIVVPPSGLEKVGADDFLAGGGTLHDLVGLATTPKQALLDEPLDMDVPFMPRSGREVVESATDVIPHFVHPVLPESAILVMAGQSGTFKTWHCLALTLDLAFGQPWLDHPDFKYTSTPINVLYVNKEMGGRLLDNRLKLLVQNARYKSIPDYKDILDERVHFLEDASLDLNQAGARDRLEEVILRLGIRVVILDSLSMCWSGDENSNSEVGVLYGLLRGMTERTGVTWIIIHHTLKPSGISKKDHIMFSVRGAGQIVQQADAAVVMNPYNETHGDPENREVTIAVAKARTDREPETFITSFGINDGFFASVRYVAKLKEAKAVDASKTIRDTKKLGEWILTNLVTWAAMKPKGPGLRTNQLVAMLRGSWPMEDKSPPSDESIKRAITGLTEEGQLVRIGKNSKTGNLYRLPEEGIQITPSGGIRKGVLEAPIKPGKVTLPDGSELETIRGYDEDDTDDDGSEDDDDDYTDD